MADTTDSPQNPLPAPPVAENPGPAAADISAAIELERVDCPHCGAELRKVRVEPGSQIRCLNCNKRFTPLATHAVSVLSAAADPPARSVREPHGADYWLLRIPAIIACAGSLFGALVAVFVNIAALFSSGIHAEVLMISSYFMLWPWYGLFVYFLTRSLARIDGNLVAIAWRAGIIRDSLPQPTGSSLPYIGPLAVTGGLLPIVVICAEGTRDASAVFIGAFYGALMFYGAFALEDLRKFVWRQGELAAACLQSEGKVNAPGPIQFSTPLFVLAGILGPLALIALGFSQWSSQWSYDWRRTENVLIFYFCIAAMLVVYSLTLVASRWDNAVAWWNQARGLHQNAGGDAQVIRPYNDRYFRPNTALKTLFCLVPVLWAAYATIWLGSMTAAGEYKISQLRNNEFWAQFFGWGFGLALSAWLCAFLWRLMNWRDSCESYWRQLCGDHSIPTAVLPRGLRALTLIGIILPCVQAGFFIWLVGTRAFRYSSPSFDEISGFPILVVMIHYPTMWFAMLLRQFLEIEAFTRAQRESLAVAQGQASDA